MKTFSRSHKVFNASSYSIFRVMDALDLDCIFHVNFDNSSNRNRNQIIDFDDELVHKAEQLSSKWDMLYRYSSLDEDVANVTQLIESTGLNADQANALTQQNLRRDITLNQESIAEDHKLIFLDKKYFQFENAHGSQPAEDDNRLSDLQLDTESIAALHTVVDGVTQPIPETVETPQIKTKKRKPRNYKRIAKLETGHAQDVSENVQGAPPGVKVVRSLHQGIDITKNSSVSLRFRL